VDKMLLPYSNFVVNLGILTKYTNKPKPYFIMAKSNKKGKTEKAKKVESKKKSKPKTAAKPKAATKVKKATKATPKKTASKGGTKKVVKKVVSKAPLKEKKVVKKTPKTNVVAEKNVISKKTTPTKVAKKNPGNFELGVVLRTGRRPEAIINKKKLETDTMGEEKLRYSDEELKEFEILIVDKLDKAKKELVYMKEMLSKKNDEGTDNTGGTMKLLEDGADTLEKENFSQLAVRQQKFVTQLENAVARIKNGTYGICIDTGKLIPKERLKAVPHTQHSIEAKLNRR
jgi:DnaK suppressor protein